jgi:putative phosphoesterase
LTVVAVIADTHLPRGARRLPDECLRRCEAADVILHLGDFVAASVLEELRELGPVEAVYGNMDEPALRETLPQRQVVELDGVRIGMTHIPGPRTGRDARLVGWFPDCRAVVYGHTHVPQVDRYEGVWILNPGSPTERRGAPTHSMLELEIAGGGAEPTLIALRP